MADDEKKPAAKSAQSADNPDKTPAAGTGKKKATSKKKIKSKTKASSTNKPAIQTPDHAQSPDPLEPGMEAATDDMTQSGASNLKMEFIIIALIVVFLVGFLAIFGDQQNPTATNGSPSTATLSSSPELTQEADRSMTNNLDEALPVADSQNMNQGLDPASRDTTQAMLNAQPSSKPKNNPLAKEPLSQQPPEVMVPPTQTLPNSNPVGVVPGSTHSPIMGNNRMGSYTQGAFLPGATSYPNTPPQATLKPPSSYPPQATQGGLSSRPFPPGSLSYPPVNRQPPSYYRQSVAPPPGYQYQPPPPGYQYQPPPPPPPANWRW